MTDRESGLKISLLLCLGWILGCTKVRADDLAKRAPDTMRVVELTQGVPRGFRCFVTMNINGIVSSNLQCLSVPEKAALPTLGPDEVMECAPGELVFDGMIRLADGKAPSLGTVKVIVACHRSAERKKP